MSLRALACSMLALAVALPAQAEPGADPAIARIIDEGLQRSEVMTNASALFDGIGARLTHSENQQKAQKWAIALLKS